MIKFFTSFSLLSRILLVCWIALGTVFPLLSMWYHSDILIKLWAEHLDIFLASIIAITVETSIILFLVITVNQLAVKAKQLKHHKARLESVVAERTSTLRASVKELEELASTDSLTKLCNRRKIKSELRDEYRRAERTGREFSLLSIDIDHFKSINDTRGHPFGDKILVAVAKAIEEAIRDIDHVGRIGGEEFLVILPETKVVEAVRVAKRIREAINQINVEGVTCTASVGVAVNKMVTSVEALLELVDQAMYAAKESGRDTIRIAALSTDRHCPSCIKHELCFHPLQRFVPVTCESLREVEVAQHILNEAK